MNDDGFLDLTTAVAALATLTDRDLARAQAIMRQVATLPLLPDNAANDGAWVGTRQVENGVIDLAVWESADQGRIIFATVVGNAVQHLYIGGTGEGSFAIQQAGSNVTVDLNSGNVRGMGWQAQLRQLQSAAQRAVRELRQPASGVDWLCPSCGWPNGADATLCGECQMPAAVSADVSDIASDVMSDIATIGDSLFADLIKVAGEEVVSSLSDAALDSFLNAPQQRHCVVCDKEIHIDAKFCHHCGAMQPLQCANCGRIAPHKSKFCPHCGDKLTTQP